MVAIKYLGATALLAISVLAQDNQQGKGKGGVDPFAGKGKFDFGKGDQQNGGAAQAGKNNAEGQQQNQDQQQGKDNAGKQNQDQQAKDNAAKAGNQGGAAGAGADAGKQNQDQQAKDNAAKAGNQGGAAGAGKNNAGGGADLALLAENVQDGSKSTGQEGADADPDQADSLTSDNNFINFCTGKTKTDGKQNQGGSCNGIPMGEIPAKNNMVSAIIINPKLGDEITAEQTFEVQVQVNNLVAGSFTNPDNTYYAAPQQLQGGKIVGHSHISIQDLGGNLNPTTAPNAEIFAFFKGINDPGNGQGLLTAVVEGGLPLGNYRVCTINSGSNHQPVLMPVAQRGVQDDCTKFVVGAGKGNAGAGDAANQGKNNGQDQGKNNGQQGQDQGKNNQGKRRWSRATIREMARRREFVA